MKKMVLHFLMYLNFQMNQRKKQLCPTIHLQWKKKAEVKTEVVVEETVVEEVVSEPVVESTFEKVEVDEDGDGINDGYDTDGDGDIDEYFEHRNCEHVWGDADGDGYEECQICGLLRSESGE